MKNDRRLSHFRRISKKNDENKAKTTKPGLGIEKLERQSQIEAGKSSQVQKATEKSTVQKGLGGCGVGGVGFGVVWGVGRFAEGGLAAGELCGGVVREGVGDFWKEREVVPKDKVLRAPKDIKLLYSKSQDPVKLVSSPISPEPSSAQVKILHLQKEPSKKNRLPYPSRVEHEKKGENDKVQIQKFWEMFKKIHVDITLADALILVPKYQKMLKRIAIEMSWFPVGRNFTFPADFVVVDFECNYQVPLILGRPFLRTARVLIDVHGEELVIRDWLERNKDSFTMGNDGSFCYFQNKELDKEILIPIPRESKIGKDCDFPSCDDFQSFKTFSNPLFEKEDDFPSRNDESILKEEVHKETLKSYLNPLFEDDEENISNEVSKQISPKVNSEPSSEFLPKDDCDSDDDLFEIDSNNDEWKRILYGEDFERMNVDSDKIKDFDKTSSNVFKSLSDELEPGGSSHVERNDLDYLCRVMFYSQQLMTDKIFTVFSGFRKLQGFNIVEGQSKFPQFPSDGLQSSLQMEGNLLILFFIE
ncbi:reverse transcriptase domain-containing protein [Tanacetum coccineum]